MTVPLFDMNSLQQGALALVPAPVAGESAAADSSLPKLDNEKLARLIDVSAAFVARVDARGRLLATNPSTATLFGYPAAYLAQVRMGDLVMPQHTRDLEYLFGQALLTRERQTGTLQFARADAECIWLDLAIQAEDDGVTAEFEVFGYDVTTWMTTERKLLEAARRDPLTGMGNRTHLHEWLTQSIEHAAASGKSFAVVLLDLDGFKRINDSLGHDMGDELLCAVSKRLQAQLRQDDMVARLGGDEFVLVARDVDNVIDAKRIAARIVTSLQSPFPIAGHQLHVTTSLGVALYPHDGQEESQLLKRADLAMYRAKERGKNQFALYSQDLEKAEAEAFALELSMFEGIKHGEFELHYQPIVNARTREVRAAEALMRWNRASGQVPPAAFIPLAEDNGLINLLGGWALRTACAQVAQWDRMGMELSYVTVNVSPVQFHNPLFPQTVMSAVTDSGLAPHRLVLEITEGALMKYPDQAATVLSELRAFGVRFAIDDFGTGYSNLAHLRRFPLSALKIDRSFVSDMPTSNHDRAIVTAVLSLAKELGLSVVAEGVELESQRELLVERGCEYTQGWLFAKALSPSQFEAAVAKKELTLSKSTDISPISSSQDVERIGL